MYVQYAEMIDLRNMVLWSIGFIAEVKLSRNAVPVKELLPVRQDTVICICFSVFVQFTFFTMPLTKPYTEERMCGLRN